MNKTKKSSTKVLTLVSVILALAIVLVGSVPVSVPMEVSLTPERVDPAVVSAIADGEDSISIIVQASGDRATLKETVARLGGRIEADFWIIDSVLTTLPPTAIQRLAAEPAVQYIALNRSTKVSDAPPPLDSTNDNSTPDEQVVYDIDLKKGLISVRYPHPLDVGLDQVHAQDVLGRGVTVAFLDTGLSTTGAFGTLIKADYKERFVGQVDFLRKRPRLTKRGQDANGHGTHVAGLVWNPFQDRDSGTYMGSAPGARILMLRVLDKDGQGKYEDAIEAIQWAIEHKDEHNIRVMNVSLYAEASCPYWADPLNRAVEAAWQAGIVVVVAAGNGGPAPMTVAVPGNDPYVITVGALDGNETAGYLDDDVLTEYSAAGPTLDLFVKPELVAPGHKLVSFLAPGSKLARERAERKRGEHWFVMNGTSAAAPLVSGTAALILEQHPDLSPDEVKYRLMASAAVALDPETEEPIYSIWQQGAGRVWAPGAVFDDLSGAANEGLDINKDLAGEEHYQGWTTWDENTQTFNLQEGGYCTWAGSYTTWAGSYTTWAGGYTTWAGGYTTWAGSWTTWAGGYTTWAGGMLSTDRAMNTGRWVPD